MNQIIHAFTTPYCQMTMVDSLTILGVFLLVGGLFLIVFGKYLN